MHKICAMHLKNIFQDFMPLTLVAQHRRQKELIASLKEIKLEYGFTFTPYAQI